ncbi:zinc finger protein ZPR1 isoform X1 [Vidua macroura]|uniref:zinc finger protein ZPR1 isoform X1 n=1 Tax=Vidua macroura TaxID=187451 RepID=UPI0023A87932|nr:zinc finger protein ZPR1 isoform X1 [Vidua macroura]
MSALGAVEAAGPGGALFRPLSAEDGEQQPAEIESLCMNCFRNGVTRLLLTRIPFFKEIIVSSFSCPSCSWSNTEIQAAGRIQEQGVRYTLAVSSRQDMNREVVKTECASARIPELDFEIPAFSQKGVLTTIEGIIDRAVAGLEQDQPARRATDKEVARKIDEFIGKLRQLKEVNSPFTFVLDDPSGNSFVENPRAPQRDEALVVAHYRRSPQQCALLGLEVSGAAPAPRGPRSREQELTPPLQGEEGEARPPDAAEDLRDEVLQFNTNCPECNAPASTNMKLVQIPHFKEVIIMATNCDSCGHRTNEVKSGGAIEPQGTRITLRITDPSDMTRDILKSETCSVEIPELEFELGMGALGGKFTTLEGLLKDIRELVEKNPFSLGDSSTPSRTGKLQEFIGRLQDIIEGKAQAHFIMDDPAGNSYLQNVYAPEEDPELRVQRYERSFEQNEELGLNDMKTEGYGPEPALGR